MKRILMRLGALFVLVALASLAPLASQQQVDQEEVYRLVNKIRKKILTLPNYGVFDYLTFGLGQGPEGYIVVLRGYASRPTLKTSADKVIGRIEGVGSVENEIEVTPVSGNDQNIRLAVYRTVYFHPSLSRYNPNRGAPIHGPGGFGDMWGRNEDFGISNDPPMGFHPISIIVKNGNVSLEGVIDTEGDKTIAGMQANSVSGVFAMTNNLQVLNPGKPKKKT